MRRETKINIRIAEDKKVELEMHAENYGVSLSAMAAFVLGQWLHSQKHIIEPMLNDMKNTGTELITSRIKQAIEAQQAQQ